MTRSVLAIALASVLIANVASGQAPAPTSSAPPAAQPPSAPAPRAASAGGGGGRAVNVAVTVTDGVGLGLAGAHVIVNGPITRDGTTVSNGSFRALGLKPGTYRFRFELDRFITLEREVTVKNGQPTELDVMLTRAPEAPKPEPVAPTPPPPASGRDSAPLPAAAFDITSYLEKDYLKSGPNRVKSIACSDTDSVDLVQTTTSYSRPAGKRQLAVVAIAGQGRVTVGGKSFEMNSRSGTTITVPADTGFEAARDGKSTLVFVVVALGSGCGEQPAANGK